MKKVTTRVLVAVLLTTATIGSLNGNSCRVRYGDETRAVTLAKGETKRVY